MKHIQSTVLPLLLAAGASRAAGAQGRQSRRQAKAKSAGKSSKSASRRFPPSSDGGSSSEDGVKEVTLSITNMAHMQPFSPFFVLVHNEAADPIYTMGGEPSDELAQLAEFGDPSALVDLYEGRDGVRSAEGTSDPTFGGDTSTITVTVSKQYPLVSIASMAINTNDCFVALNGIEVKDGMVLDTPGLDAGSEKNDESCDSVPGPACDGKGNQTDRSGDGEGFVHVHRGIQGVGDLEEPGMYDWLNPMMRVAIS